MSDETKTTIKLECPECDKTAIVTTDLEKEDILVLLGCSKDHPPEDMVKK